MTIVISNKNKISWFPYKTAISENNVKTNRMGCGGDGVTKMDLSQRAKFCHELLHFFENFVPVYEHPR